MPLGRRSDRADGGRGAGEGPLSVPWRPALAGSGRDLPTLGAGRYSDRMPTSSPLTPAQKTAELIAVVTFALVFLGLILEHNVLIPVSLVLFIVALLVVGVMDARR